MSHSGGLGEGAWAWPKELEHQASEAGEAWKPPMALEDLIQNTS